jgi:hypothetical protein
VRVQDPDNLGDLQDTTLVDLYDKDSMQYPSAYRFIGSVGFAQSGGRAVDLLDHAAEILAHLIQTLR